MWHTHGYNRDCFPVFTNQPIKRYSICLFRFSSALADALRMLEIFVVKKKKNSRGGLPTRMRCMLIGI